MITATFNVLNAGDLAESCVLFVIEWYSSDGEDRNKDNMAPKLCRIINRTGLSTHNFDIQLRYMGREAIVRRYIKDASWEGKRREGGKARTCRG